MKTSKGWIQHFKSNAEQHRIDWNVKPELSKNELSAILHSLQAWQLGETSDGAHLLRAAAIYAKKIKDPDYVEGVTLFIKEEQKHGNNLGRYLDAINQPRIKSDWGDTLFRKVRYFNTNMEIWTLAVITVESAAQVFYQSLKDATRCNLLKQICTDILIDEAHHIDFQTERMAILFQANSFAGKMFRSRIYPVFYFFTSFVVWMAHKKLFRAGGNDFKKYWSKMKCKYMKTLHGITYLKERNPVQQGSFTQSISIRD